MEEEKKISLKITVENEDIFIIIYSRRPTKTQLNMLAENYYMKIQNQGFQFFCFVIFFWILFSKFQTLLYVDNCSGKVVGEYVDNRAAWGFPHQYYFELVKLLETLPKVNVYYKVKL